MDKEKPRLDDCRPSDIFSVADSPDYWTSKGIYFIGGQVGMPVRYESDSREKFVSHVDLVNYHPGTMYSQPEVTIEEFNVRWEKLYTRKSRMLMVDDPTTYKPIAVARFYVPGGNEEFFDRMKQLREVAIKAGENTPEAEAYRKSFEQEILNQLTPFEIKVLGYQR